MKRKKSATTINLEDFELPCSKQGDESIGEDGYDRNQALEDIENGLPTSVIKVGRFKDEVDNFTSWQVEDHFFIYPWPNDKFDWALIRITWDDNWGRWGVGSCARIAGESDPLKAARRMLTALLAEWGYDQESNEYRHFKTFIRRLSIV